MTGRIIIKQPCHMSHFITKTYDTNEKFYFKLHEKGTT